MRLACENYVKHVRSRKNDAKGDEIEARFERWVYADKMLARIELSKLTRASLEAWRNPGIRATDSARCAPSWN